MFVTGDGNDNGGHGSFYANILELLRRGISVEIWSFRANLKNKYLRELKPQFPDLFTVHLLDDRVDFLRGKLHFKVLGSKPLPEMHELLAQISEMMNPRGGETKGRAATHL